MELSLSRGQEVLEVQNQCQLRAGVREGAPRFPPDQPGRPMSGPHVFGLQNTADGVSTITSRLDERFATERIQKTLSAFRVLKRQVDDGKTMKQLAATGQDRTTRDRLPKTCCEILKHYRGEKCKRKVAPLRNYSRRARQRAAIG